MCMQQTGASILCWWFLDISYVIFNHRVPDILPVRHSGGPPLRDSCPRSQKPHEKGHPRSSSHVNDKKHAERAKNRVSVEQEVAERTAGVPEIGLSAERLLRRSSSAHMLCLLLTTDKHSDGRFSQHSVIFDRSECTCH